MPKVSPKYEVIELIRYKNVTYKDSGERIDITVSYSNSNICKIYKSYPNTTDDIILLDNIDQIVLHIKGEIVPFDQEPTAITKIDLSHEEDDVPF